MSENTTIAMASQKTVLTRAESLRAAAGSLRSFDPVRQAPPLPPSASRGPQRGRERVVGWQRMVAGCGRTHAAGRPPDAIPVCPVMP